MENDDLLLISIPQGSIKRTGDFDLPSVMDGFQFHKVRLKGFALIIMFCSMFNFNSTRFD